MTIDEAYLFDKGQRIDRVTIKHQIAYHFQQKAVKEVTQELFISRLIDVGPLIDGLALLNQTATGLQQYCKMKRVKSTPGNHTPAYQEGRYNPFWFVAQGTFSYAEAKARCIRLGKQLPEIYTAAEGIQLNAVFANRGISKVFAGIELDLGDPSELVYRFVSTGKPMFKGLYRYLKPDGRPLMLKHQANYTHYHFAYSGNHKMQALIMKVESPDYEQTPPYDYIINEVVVDGLICQDIRYETLTRRSKRQATAGDSSAQQNSASVGQSVQATTVLNGNPVDPSVSEPDDQLDETCNALIAQMVDFHKDTYQKINRLLTLVDIDMAIKAQTADEVNSESRRRRFASVLSKVIFKKGTKLLWGLFGFWQQVRIRRKIKGNADKIQAIDRRLNKTELVNANQQVEIDEGRRRINEATQLLKEQSVALGDLVLATKELDARMAEMESHLKTIDNEVDALKNQMTIMTTVMLLSILTSRITMAIDNGYEQLSEVIHTSLLGQTSPLVLPLAQMEEVQRKLADLTITAVLDKDYSKMKSVVTADPGNSGYLLVIVNAVAVSHQKLELIKLTPIPFYDKTKGYYPILDYQYVALNQLANTFTILSEEEAQSCIDNRCYISQMEQNIHSQSCGMPQFQDHALEACDTEGIPHDGMFVQAANPDGVLFSFRNEVKTQLFCKNNDQIMAPHKMSGAGVMFVPPGCVLNAIDKGGKVVKVKGGPSHHLIEISNLDLTNDPLLTIPNAETSIEEGGRKSSAEKAMEHQLLIVQESMDAAHRNVGALQQKIWITTGCFISVMVIIIIVVAVLYRYSRRFQYRFKKVIGGFATLRDRFEEVDVMKREVAQLAANVMPSRLPQNSLGIRSPFIRPRRPPAREYIHLENQAQDNQLLPSMVRTYDKVPVRQTEVNGGAIRLPNAVPRIYPPLVLPRIHPNCPEDKTDNSDDEDVSSCKSLGQLSLVARYDLNTKEVKFEDETSKKE